MARVTLVTDEILGYTRTGGIGTATTFLAIAIGRMGHRVEILYTGDAPATPLRDEWAELYDGAGVSIQRLRRSTERMEPSYFGRMRDVELALTADPPDVVVVQDLAAPAYTAIRRRTLGLGFEHTLFVVYCHGTRQWITDAARKVRVLPGALAITNLERTSIELADIVVSPSAYLLDWMRAQGWRLPETTRVIPHLTRATATGELQTRAEPSDERVQCIAYFGRLEERKGIAPFIDGINALPRPLLDGVDVEFIGRATPAWAPDRVRSLLREDVNASFATDLDQPDALARLTRPGTLAVMPSFEETFGNTVQECLDHGVPFIASTAAAIRELVASDEHDRVLFEPTTEGMTRALRRVLESDPPWQPARAALDRADARTEWERVIAATPSPLPEKHSAEMEVDVIVCPPNRRAQELARGTAPLVVFLDEDDDPVDEFVSTLLRAQQCSGADVVSCGLRLPTQAVHLFHGQPRGLGLLFNGYGTVALIRRSLLDALTPQWPTENDPDWPLFAKLSLDGARIVSVPAPLVTTTREPGTVTNSPSDALLVVQHFERALPERLRGLARLTTGLAAARQAPSAPTPRNRRAVLRRLVRRNG